MCYTYSFVCNIDVVGRLSKVGPIYEVSKSNGTVKKRDIAITNKRYLLLFFLI